MTFVLPVQTDSSDLASDMRDVTMQVWLSWIRFRLQLSTHFGETVERGRAVGFDVQTEYGADPPKRGLPIAR